MTTVENNLTQFIAEGKNNLLNIYFTAGFPNANSTVPILKALSKADVEIAEIGIPFSDPIADGPTIQRAASRALANGTTLNSIFRQLKEFRAENKNLCLLLMGYFNPVLKYGVERFCEKCADSGVSGVILPDLPVEVFIKQYQSVFSEHNLSNIFLVTPESSEQRVRLIDKHSSGFIYAVSSSSTTGQGKGLKKTSAFLSRLQQMNLKNPVLCGFNINSKSSFNKVCNSARGGIIGSAFIQHIEKNGYSEKNIKAFVHKIRPAK